MPPQAKESVLEVGTVKARKPSLQNPDLQHISHSEFYNPEAPYSPELTTHQLSEQARPIIARNKNERF